MKLQHLYALVFCRKQFFKFHYYLYKIALTGMGINNSFGFKSTGEYYVLNKLLSNYNIKTIFDVGAHRGNYSKLLSAKFPKSMIYSFEPNPETFHDLNTRITGTNIKKFNLGFSNCTGKANLYDLEKRQGTAYASLYKGVFEDIYECSTKSFSIKLTEIDTFLEKHQINCIDFLKIDTEGNDFNVLLGAKNTLQNAKIKIIQFEFNKMYVYPRHFMKDFKNLLQNYNLYRILTHGLILLNFNEPVDYEIFAFQNILAIQKNQDVINSSK